MANEIEDYKFYYDVESNLVDIDTRNDLVITTTHSTTAFTSVRALGIKSNNYPFAAHIDMFSEQTSTRFWEVFGEEPKFKMFTRYDKGGTIPESAITLSRPKGYR